MAVQIVSYELTGIKNSCIKIKGIYNNKLSLNLLGNDKKIDFKLNKDEDSFILEANLKGVENIVLKNEEEVIIEIKNKLSKRIINKIKYFFSSYFYDIYNNENIDFSSIQLSGIIHSNLTISGKKNEESEIFIKNNNLNLKYDVISDEKGFYYSCNLSSKNKVIDIYLNNKLVLKIYNKLMYRIINKIYNLITRMFNKVFHIFYVFYRGVRAAWKQYHFLIPPRLWKKYWIEMIKKLKNKENKLFYNPDNIYEYNKWLQMFELEEEKQELKYNPLISLLIPVYNINKEYLSACIDSILNNTYENFEICLVDDASTNKETINTLKEYEKKDKRIKVKYRKENGHISNATNDALKMAKGEFIGLIDNDDLITDNALYEVVKVLNENKKIDFIYSDEDKINKEGKRCYPHFKPDFSPDTLMSLNYICHFSVIRKTLVEKVGGFLVGIEGAQDHDLFLKISEITNKIHHIPKILYHWRMVEGSTAATLSNKSYAQDKGKIVVENALKRRNLIGTVTKDESGYYLVDYKLKKEPLISIIIPTKDFSDILDKCIKSIYKKTTYKNFEIIIVNNNSVEEKTFKLFDSYKNNYDNIKIIDANIEFNYSKINNIAVKEAKGEYVLLLNNDTEVITPNWLEAMVGYASLPHIGAVGVKLLYPDNTIQHGGVILGLGGVGSHAYTGSNRFEFGMYGRLRVPYNYSAVTAACLMVKKDKFNEVKGLEEQLKVAYNDIDFNIKLLEKGYYNIFLPQVELYHHESKSRGYDTTSEKYQRFLKEQEFMYNKWKNIIENDKMYNKNFTKKYWFLLDKRNK